MPSHRGGGFTEIHLTNTNNITSGEAPSINEEVRQAKTNNVTLDKFSNWYEYENQILVGFPLLSKYDNVLRTNNVRIELEKKYWYRPEYLSHELFGTTDLWYVLMYLNDLTEVTEFNMESVVIPTTDVVQLINNIVLNEGNSISRRYSPTPIKKNFLKKLEEPSTEIIAKYPEVYTPWQTSAKIFDKTGVFTRPSRYLLDTYTANQGVLESLDGQLVPAITLDEDGLTSIPSVFYTEGYTHKLTGRVNLRANTRYSLNSIYNGTTHVKITDPDLLGPVVDMQVEHLYPEAMLLADLRAANRELAPITGKPLSYENDVLGQYRSYVDGPISNITGSTLNLNLVEFTSDTDEEILKANRLSGYDHLFFNLEYANDLSDSNILGYGYTITVTYTDGSTSLTTIDNKNKYYDTQREISYLKGSMHIDRGKKVSKVTARVNIHLKPGTTSVKLYHSLYSLELTGVRDQTLVNEFSVGTNKWYNIDIDYTYSLVNEDFRSKKFKDRSFTGIYFNPSISEVTGYGDKIKINQHRKPSMQDHGTRSTAKPKTLDLRNALNFGSRTSYQLGYGPTNLPSKYILDFTLNLQGTDGGVGLLLDYNPRRETGYLLWVPGYKQTTTTIPTLSTTSKKSLILDEGFYELDDIDGELHPVFAMDTSLNLRVSNYHPINLQGKRLRLIKKGNRIKIYPYTGTEVDFQNPVLDIEDLANIHMQGRFGLLSIFGTGTITIHKYYDWE